MISDLQAIKAIVEFETLVLESHDINHEGKVICPFHCDHSPSCHIYRDGCYCFACGAHGDHIDWLQRVYKLSTAEAIRELKRRAKGRAPRFIAQRSSSQSRAVSFRAVSDDLLERHQRLAARLSHVPLSMEGRGFSTGNLRRLKFAVVGDDVVFPVTSPEGVTLTLKRRYAKPRRAGRYTYETPGHGTPAWCSPDFLGHTTVLVVEGELNGMACWLAAPQHSVMGVAGSSGALYTWALEGRVVYVYADGDEAGQIALTKWTRQAIQAGSEKVYALAPWPEDACDVAGRNGFAGLAERISTSLLTADEVTTKKGESMVGTATQAAEHRSISRRQRLSRWFR
jgi:DNA primase